MPLLLGGCRKFWIIEKTKFRKISDFIRETRKIWNISVGLYFCIQDWSGKNTKPERIEEWSRKKGNTLKNCNNLLRRKLCLPTKTVIWSRRMHREQWWSWLAQSRSGCQVKRLCSCSLRSLHPFAPDWDLEHLNGNIWSSFFFTSSKDKGVCWPYRRGSPHHSH